ncbi:hypothetical protein BCR33DRAFT_788466 [Rhizoclosmatium globosum]|uniref:Uncharacterized protein n=1 Tax=Rhizoclosmatium globosum TaxID=329046 RepID=A0A1Y2BWJ1_9FUNG|nr:hypothetical protein BCR33DRAFT_788466 [Rhizoclosmatium globosum]|eukprot:ORY39017.1 hypothetical protein BCR33DRAFT_788466 [Rhizoclosmatium globosum]
MDVEAHIELVQSDIAKQQAKITRHTDALINSSEDDADRVKFQSLIKAASTELDSLKQKEQRLREKDAEIKNYQLSKNEEKPQKTRRSSEMFKLLSTWFKLPTNTSPTETIAIALYCYYLLYTVYNLPLCRPTALECSVPITTPIHALLSLAPRLIETLLYAFFLLYLIVGAQL